MGFFIFEPLLDFMSFNSGFNAFNISLVVKALKRSILNTFAL